MSHPNSLSGDDGWTFQLLSIPRSHHAAEDAFSNAPQWSGDLHLVHTIAGRGILHVGRQRYETTPEVVLAVPIFQHCHWEKVGPSPWTMINIHARLHEADMTPLHEQPLLPICFRPEDIAASHLKLAQWHEDWARPDLPGRARAAAGVLGLISSYLGGFVLPRDSRMADAQMGLLRERLQKQAHLPFDAEILARGEGLSVSQVNRRFRARYGISPRAYWHLHRLTLAQSMLISTPMSVSAISEALGFSDIYYFSRWFRQKSTRPPTAYRRLYRSM